jgi:UDP-N-acetylmuramate dehydrogenase
LIKNEVWKNYQSFTADIPFDYSKNSTIGCGGTAQIAFYPQTVLELSALIEKLCSDNLAYRVLGNLSNVLPPDGVGKEWIVSTKRLQDFQTEKTFYVSAGVTCGMLMRVCSLIGKSGLEFLAGIPCTVGGALYMNAGVNGKYIAETVESVRILQSGKEQVLSVDECEYSYKSSVFMRRDCVILGANFRLTQSSSEQVKAAILERINARKALPKGRSMGCVFKNPQGAFAGKLIEGAGLKGMRVGGAVVSKEHANFIINDNRATASDIKALIGVIKNAVFAQYKIRLQEEIRYLE